MYLCALSYSKGFSIKEYEEKLKEEAEQKRKSDEHESSHCHYCNNKSIFFHFIRDKRTGKVWDSWSNAADPINQQVFCNKGCYANWLRKENTYTYHQCQTSKDDGNYLYNQVTNDSKKFCSDACFEQHYVEKCDTCRKKIGSGEKSYYQNATSKSGTLCQSCWQTKKSASNNSTATPVAEETRESSYSPPVSSSANLPKENASGSDNNSNSDNRTPITSSTFTNKSSADGEEQCGVCDKMFTDTDEHAKQNPQCGNFAKACEMVLNKGALTHPDTDLSERGRIIIQVLENLKIRKKWVDIDRLNLTERAKTSLKELREQLGLKREEESESSDDHSFQDGEIKPFYQELHIIMPVLVGIFIFSLIIVIRVIRRRRKKKIK